jgi:hypothetical protein
VSFTSHAIAALTRGNASAEEEQLNALSWQSPLQVRSATATGLPSESTRVSHGTK